MHYYKFNIADWHLGTSHLSLEEEAAYLRLINYYYDTEEPIPLETDRVFRRLRLGKGSDVGLSVLDEFFTKTKDGWIHERCDRELEKYQEKADKSRENGRKGGRPKKNNGLGENEEEPSGFSVGTQEEPRDNLNQEPLTTNHKPQTKSKGGSRTGGSPVTFTGWLKKLDEVGEKPIPPDDSLFKYVDNAGIPHDWLRAYWVEFKTEFSEKDKRQKDWRAHFRNFVRKNYYQLWWVDGGEYKLTSRGQQAMMAIRGSETNAN